MCFDLLLAFAAFSPVSLYLGVGVLICLNYAYVWVGFVAFAYVFSRQVLDFYLYIF